MSDRDRLKLVIIIGSIRHGRVSPVIAEWFGTTALGREDLQVDVIDLAEACLPEVLSDAEPKPEPVQVLAPWLAAADAFVIIAPEYNRGFPGPLKTAIDWYQDEWKGKPVGFVSYGSSGGLRAIEQLRQVFSAVHAVTVRDSVSLDPRYRLADAGDRACALRHSSVAAATMLDQLIWWARALRPARAGYPGLL